MVNEAFKDQEETILEPVVLVDIIENPEADKSLKDPRPGDVCPKCDHGYFDYDGLLNLVCVNCGYTLSGCST